MLADRRTDGGDLVLYDLGSGHSDSDNAPTYTLATVVEAPHSIESAVWFQEKQVV